MKEKPTVIQITVRVATEADLDGLARLNARFNDIATTVEQIAENCQRW